MVLRSDPRQYMRLAAFLREQIVSGRLAPGSRVPSITVLCREHGTSRRTAGRAMQILEEEALIQRVPGLGYFVRELDELDELDEVDEVDEEEGDATPTS